MIPFSAFVALFLSVLAQADEAEDLAKEMEQWREGALKQIEMIQGQAKSQNQHLHAIQEKAARIASDETITKSAQELWAHPQRKNVIWWNIGFFVFMLFFKAWRQSKSKNWITRLLSGLILSLVTWSGMIFFVPWAILGAPYKTLITRLIQIVFS